MIKRNRREIKMKSKLFIISALSIIMIASGSLTSPLLAEPPDTTPKLHKNDYALTIDGTATLVGKWACGGDARVEATPGQIAEPVPGLATGLQSVAVTTSVPDIDCGDSTMNKHLRKALKYNDFPEIRYRALKYTLVDGGAAVQTSGELTIAGVTRTVDLGAKLIPLPGDGARLTGKVEIDMRDYGVKPPSLFFGALKVANLVTVQFNAVINLPQELAQALFAKAR
jgi:hypothetical protein